MHKAATADLPPELQKLAGKAKKERAKKKDAGFGAECVGRLLNECLVVIDIRGGVLSRVCVCLRGSSATRQRQTSE